MMPIVLPNYDLTRQLPQPRIVITARRDQIRRVSTERTVPHPSLMALQRSLQGKRIGLAVQPNAAHAGAVHAVGELERAVGPRRRFGLAAEGFGRGGGRGRGKVDEPDARGVIGGAGGEVFDVWGEEDTGDVGWVGGEFADGDEGGSVESLEHAPHVYVPL